MLSQIYRFVEVRTGASQYSFNVPAGKCGTELDNFAQKISNVLIFQMDENVQVIYNICNMHIFI